MGGQAGREAGGQAGMHVADVLRDSSSSSSGGGGGGGSEWLCRAEATGLPDSQLAHLNCKQAGRQCKSPTSWPCIQANWCGYRYVGCACCWSREIFFREYLIIHWLTN